MGDGYTEEEKQTDRDGHKWMKKQPDSNQTFIHVMNSANSIMIST